MPIVIEEVTGVVEPESTAAATPPPNTSQPARSAPDPRALRGELRRMASRRVRLWAD